ncbi:hypothetical protein KEM56_002009 [Ascosphaera pollenicola]|nr:hypothetical protein KEM56_002009 [Ascosphaera pollenicola]
MFALATLLLHFKRVNMDVVQSRTTTESPPTDGEPVLAQPQENCHQVNIKLENYRLAVRRSVWTMKGPSAKVIQIINPLHSDFQPGKLNVIMGPSGSGKTSLLSSLAGRLKNSYGTKYDSGGRMLYDGSVPSHSVLKLVTSFVTQDDDALMASLTVRETLRFAAGLRLPPWMSKKEKHRRAEDILLRMGLKSCADNLIGSEFVKGISGGEKRRVGIAVQILTDPKVLLLDEPTSGLDAFTAASIIEVLRNTCTRRKDTHSYNPSVSSQEGKDYVRTIEAPAELGKFRLDTNPLRVVFPLVLKRSAINFWRQSDLIFARIFQVIGFVIILAWFFAPLKSDYEAIQTRMGLIQQMTSYYFVGMTKNIAVYPFERDVFYREEEDGAYSVEAFILQYTTFEVVFDIITSFISGIFYSFVIGVNKDFKTAMILAYNAFCLINCGESLGIMACTLFSNVGFAVNIMALALSVATIMGGVLSLNIPSVLSAVNYLSPLKYSLANVAPYSIKDMQFSCSVDQRLPNGDCPISTGTQVLQLYKLDKDARLYVIGTASCALAYRLLAYTLLRFERSTTVGKTINRLSRKLHRKTNVTT